jgi:hypothetical protein
MQKEKMWSKVELTVVDCNAYIFTDFAERIVAESIAHNHGMLLFTDSLHQMQHNAKFSKLIKLITRKVAEATLGVSEPFNSKDVSRVRNNFSRAQKDEFSINSEKYH